MANASYAPSIPRSTLKLKVIGATPEDLDVLRRFARVVSRAARKLPIESEARERVAAIGKLLSNACTKQSQKAA